MEDLFIFEIYLNIRGESFVVIAPDAEDAKQQVIDYYKQNEYSIDGIMKNRFSISEPKPLIRGIVYSD